MLMLHLIISMMYIYKINQLCFISYLILLYKDRDTSRVRLPTTGHIFIDETYFIEEESLHRFALYQSDYSQ